jgi:hypothetical protein
MLYLPDGSCASPEQSISGTPPDYPVDKTVTAHASANTKGSWTAIISSLPRGADHLILMISSTGLSGGNIGDAVDIAIAQDPASIIIPDLLVSRIRTQDTSNFGAIPFFISIPIRIPRGAGVHARMQSSTGGHTCSIAAYVPISGKRFPDAPTFTRCDAYGVNTSGATSGTAHTCGNSSVNSTAVNFGAVLTRNYSGAILVCDGNPSAAANALAYQCNLQINGSQFCRGYFSTDTTEIRMGPIPIMIWRRPLPAGSQMQIQGQCSGTAQSLNFAAYLFY